MSGKDAGLDLNLDLSIDLGLLSSSADPGVITTDVDVDVDLVTVLFGTYLDLDLHLATRNLDLDPGQYYALLEPDLRKASFLWNRIVLMWSDMFRLPFDP